MFRGFAILCAIVAAIQLFFLIGDRVTGVPFHGWWLLIGGVFWGAVFLALDRFDRNKKKARP